MNLQFFFQYYQNCLRFLVFNISFTEYIQNKVEKDQDWLRELLITVINNQCGTHRYPKIRQ